jgi:signal transduction histidine kinase
MQETIKKREDIDLYLPPPVAASQGGIAIQLGFSHLVAAAATLGLFLGLDQFHVQQLYALLISLAAAGLCGVLCTLNLQYGLYLLEMTLSRLTHGHALSSIYTDHTRREFVRRWPLGPLFLRVQGVERRLTSSASNDVLTAGLREKALQQVSEAAALAERTRIARELHDSIKQQIFSISVSAAAAKMLWQGESSEDARTAIEDIQRSAKEAQVEMQALLQQLRPTPLENTGLLEALHIQAQALGFRTGAQVHVELGALPENDRLLPGTQETIFRLVQETFANIARHARAHTIWLTLHSAEQALHIEIRDDGQGFDTAIVRAGMGLTNLHERAQELHGRVEVSSQPGRGTTVRISLPLLEALRNPTEEARQKYEQAHANEQARRGYQLCMNGSLFGTVTGLAGILTALPLLWGLIVLGSLLIAIYGYIAGVYYRTRVALSAGRESIDALELSQNQYRAGLNLLRLTSIGALYAFNLARPLHSASGHWLLIGVLVCVVVFLQLSRWRYRQETEHYYSLLSRQELSWELERRGQTLTRLMTTWGVVCVVGLISGRTLFVFPPLTLAQQNAYVLAIILLLMGVSTITDYRQIQRWKRTRDASERGVPSSAKEGR